MSSSVEPGVRTALSLRVTGVVQGVGFRPFVRRLAVQHNLAGWVQNTAGDVQIEVEGDPAAIDRFVHRLRHEAPRLAHIDLVEGQSREPTGLDGFEILGSSTRTASPQAITPDAALCPQCERELFDPADRRYRYPFITCTDCGPRFTIIEQMPFDRERTTMRRFPQCPKCLSEYADPANRRYHSETNSCFTCGPRLWLAGKPDIRGNELFADLAVRLRDGAIVALRGLGGFHLAVDATNGAAVARLRERKQRDAKPFAIMVRTLKDARQLARISAEEAELLVSRQRPIVLLRGNPDSGIAAEVAPGLNNFGIVLAYTPLHHLLLESTGRPLVMTSGNRSDEPIAIANAEAEERLRGIADVFLLHDREIAARYDDSVVRVAAGRPILIRRARGYAPLPLSLPIPSPRPLLAVGPQIKNTFALAEGSQAFVSQHIGDLDDVVATEHFLETLRLHRRLFRIEPQVIVRDLHPEYTSTRIAEQIGRRSILTVQHHHAHIAAVMAEHGIVDPVIGVAFDGAGYGDDGTTWGAEFLVADLYGYRRAAHLRYVRLPGGDLAARRPWRAALGYLALDPSLAPSFHTAFDRVAPREVDLARRQIQVGLNAPLVSSMGRLFDAAAAILGVRDVARYEGQAAMELESLAGDLAAAPLPFPMKDGTGVMILDPLPLLHALGSARAKGVPSTQLAAAFHESVAAATAATVLRLCREEEIHTVALGGGVFQNARLLATTHRRLEEHGLRVLVPAHLSPNDGSVSYGQAAVAAARLAREAALCA